jgi:hypothetical protein
MYNNLCLYALADALRKDFFPFFFVYPTSTIDRANGILMNLC